MTQKKSMDVSPYCSRGVTQVSRRFGSPVYLQTCCYHVSSCKCITSSSSMSTKRLHILAGLSIAVATQIGLWSLRNTWMTPHKLYGSMLCFSVGFFVSVVLCCFCFFSTFVNWGLPLYWHWGEYFASVILQHSRKRQQRHSGDQQNFSFGVDYPFNICQPAHWFSVSLVWSLCIFYSLYCDYGNKTFKPPTSVVCFGFLFPLSMLPYEQ